MFVNVQKMYPSALNSEHLAQPSVSAPFISLTSVHTLPTY